MTMANYAEACDDRECEPSMKTPSRLGGGTMRKDPPMPTLSELSNLIAEVIAETQQGLTELESLYDSAATRLGCESHYDRPTAEGIKEAAMPRPERIGHFINLLSEHRNSTGRRLRLLSSLHSQLNERLD